MSSTRMGWTPVGRRCARHRTCRPGYSPGRLIGRRQLRADGTDCPWPLARRPPLRPGALALYAGLLCTAAAPALADASYADFDFTVAATAQEWTAAHDIAALTPAANGLLVDISGDDPYLHGPARDYPAGQPLWLHLRLKAARPGTGQVFWYGAGRSASEADSVRFPVPGAGWQELRVPLPALGPGTCLRLDPPGQRGDRVVLARLRVEPRSVPRAPSWPVPTAPAISADDPAVRAGPLALRHNRTQLGGFVVEVAGQPMACGLTTPLAGYLLDGATHWLDLAQSAQVRVAAEGDGLRVVATAGDAHGGIWRLEQVFVPRSAGAFDVTVAVEVSADRSVVFLPLLAVLPGVGGFGAHKQQALFAGLEYLDRDEPSSSEADVIGPGAQRQVPDALKITLPLMALAAEGRYIGLAWEQDPRFAALFDSPDRQFQAGGHLLALLLPGSSGSDREAGSLLPYDGTLLKAGQRVLLCATLIGGPGESVVPAIRQYVQLHGLPPVPATGLEWEPYAATAAAGWLDSAIRAGDRYRHAFPGGFAPQPAADAAAMMLWLAPQVRDGDLARRLRDAAGAAAAQVPPAQLWQSGVAHVRPPAAALVFGHDLENLAAARQHGRALLARFAPDGTVHYARPAAGLDLGRTHSAPDASGLTADVVARVLAAACFTGDRGLREEGLARARALDRYAGTVPRGAQTWEVPLHTPDILAAAHLVRAYTLAYELSGAAELLARAQEWAWTGVPFVYLVPPTDGPVGLYATIAVYGATHWTAPNWMGLPVQWCGLVYADALYGLARHDPGGPWRQFADGITASGVQQTWPRGSDPQRQGLLPDSFDLRARVRNDAAINPGTVLACAVRLYQRVPLYDYRVLRRAGVIVHAPGEIGAVREEGGQVSFTVAGWSAEPYEVLVVGLKSRPRVWLGDTETPLAAPHAYDADAGAVALRLAGKVNVRLALED